MRPGYSILVVAKAPVPGLAKTRLSPPATPSEAAELAAASLVDSLDAALSVPHAEVFVAMTGKLAAASRADELGTLLDRCTVFPQRGEDFAHRLAAAHADVGALRPDRSVVQVGMDTPQLTPALFDEVADGLADADAVLGPAHDGGWWVLGLRDPHAAEALASVPMSREDTGSLTLRALRGAGLETGLAGELTDVDTFADAEAVADLVPETRFAAALRAVRERTVAR